MVENIRMHHFNILDTCRHTYPLTRTHTHAYTHMHMHAINAHTHTHTHTHTQSYCPKHTASQRSSRLNSPHKNHTTNEPTQLIQVQQAFYKYTSPDDLTKELNLSPKLSTLLYNYWKLKRKVPVALLYYCSLLGPNSAPCYYCSQERIRTGD